MRNLAEDPNEKGPDDFFGIIDQFVSRIAEARGDILAMKRREEEERRKREAASTATAVQAEKNVCAEAILDTFFKIFAFGYSDPL